MAATERRAGLSRRGMTVLGKIPVAPKPINLPSQRLENQGLFPEVDIVPRGTCSWGHAGRFPGAGGNKSGKLGSASSISSGGDQIQHGKVESKPVASSGNKNSGVKDGGGLPESSIQSSSANGRANPSSGGATITAQASSDSIRKMEGPRSSSSYNCSSSDGRIPKTADPVLQKSGDGYIRGVSVPPGFCNGGPHGNQSRAGVAPSEFPHNGIGTEKYSDTSQQNGLHNFPGMPYRSGTKDREIIVIHMVGNPGCYGNYPPQIGYPQTYSRNGMYGNFPLQFGNFEPYFGRQGHGRLHGGAQISAATSSDLFDEHEDFICYEKECYKGACHDLMRQKNGWVRGSFRESAFLGGAQSDVHEALICDSTSALKSRSISQKHLSRNAGRLKSMYRNGRVVSMEALSAVPVPEKRITLLTKLSQREMSTNNSLEGTEVCEVAHAQGPVDSVISDCWNKRVCEDEGKAPTDTAEVGKVVEDAQAKKSVAAGASVSLERADEVNMPKETRMGSNEVSVMTTSCNDKCLHCKAEAAALEGPPALVCHACKKAMLCESTLSTSQCCLRPTEEVSFASIENSNGVDGCKVEVKHVIFDADSHSLDTLKGQEDSSWSSLREAAATSKNGESLSRTENNNSSIQNNQEEKEKQRLLGKKSIDRKLKPKRAVGAAKVDFKVFAPQARKAVTKEATIKTSVNDYASEASSLANCNKKVSSSNMGADSTALSSQTETCKMQCQEYLLPSSLSSSEALSVGDSLETLKEKPDSVASVSVDCVASDRHFQKKKRKNLRKITLHKDCHDNVAAVQAVESQESSVKVFEDITRTEGQKQEPKGACSTNETAWRPKMPATLQSNSALKASGIQVSKAHVVPRNLGLQGRKSHLAVSSNASAHLEQHPKVKRGKCFSLWKPKVASETSGIVNVFSKEENESGNSTSGASNESTGSLSSSPAAPSSNLHADEYIENHAVQKLLLEPESGSDQPLQGENHLPLEPESVSSQPLQGDNYLLNLEDAMVSSENREVLDMDSEKLSAVVGSMEEIKRVSVQKHSEEVLDMDSQKLSAVVGSMEEMKNGSVQKHSEEALDMDSQKFSEIVGSKEEMKHGSVQKRSEEVPPSTDNSQKSISGNGEPFIRKSMNFKKANRYHQLFFKRYKAVGQWKPKAGPHNQVLESARKGCARQGNTQASMKA